jgi:uncharacterized membrane protein SpoIIM required for sporulation/ABC-type transport system involved in multi-copper enzyme maturation permease subunit
MLSNALIITRRELRDSLRDWRILTPIAVLSCGFPWLMLLLAQIVFAYARNFDQEALFFTVVPFSLMIVGFFPISFCLIIALEAFVGEKERNSLEPLLAAPITDFELYLGKLLACMVLPLIASLIGLTLFIIGLKWAKGLDVPQWMLWQIVLLTVLEALLMVGGAVVVSSHTTSVRAANLLASFIIVPMTLLVQGESILILNNKPEVLWIIMGGLIVANLIVTRMGIRLFNREEILAREMDELNMRRLSRTFWNYLTEGYGRFSFVRFYRHDLPAILARNRLALGVTTLVVLIGLVGGWVYAFMYPMPPDTLPLKDLTADQFMASLKQSPYFVGMPHLTLNAIFVNNVRSLALAGLVGLFSFGTLALVLLMAPMGILGFLGSQIGMQGYAPWTFMLAVTVPHGILEIPAAILATGLALQMGAAMIAPRNNLTAGEGVLLALADFLRTYLLVVVPLLFVAAYIEADITPQVVAWCLNNRCLLP